MAVWSNILKPVSNAQLQVITIIMTIVVRKKKPLVYSSLKLDPAGCGGSIDGGGWTVVRHVPAGNRWYKSKDELVGTEVYGDPKGGAASAEQWSIRFDETPFDQFLFSLGDCSKWMITTKQAVRLHGSNFPGPIVKSSKSATSYEARWYHRPGNEEDPWLSLSDHGPAIGAGEILYGENSYGGPHAANTLPASKGNGANVYIRKLK